MIKTTPIALFDNESNWVNRLQSIINKGELWICTYSIPRGDSIVPLLIHDRAGMDTVLVCNPTANKVIERAYMLKKHYPLMRIILHPRVHAKMVLIDSYSFISTENFGSNEGWFERTVCIQDKEIHDKNLEDLKTFLRKNPGVSMDTNYSIDVYFNRFQPLYHSN